MGIDGNTADRGGTLKSINSCEEAGLPEPEIIEQDGEMLVTIFKGIYQDEVFSKYALNERQRDALRLWKDEGEITTRKYKNRFSVTDRTSRRDLLELVQLGILSKVGEKKSIRYLFK